MSKTTLIRQVYKFINSGEQSFHYHHNRDKKRVFNDTEERQLVEYMETAANLYYGLSIKDIKVLAYEFSKENNKHFDKSWEENGMAGDFWFRLFRSKYSDRISLRKPEATSLLLTEEMLLLFFKLLQSSKKNSQPCSTKCLEL